MTIAAGIIALGASSALGEGEAAFEAGVAHDAVAPGRVIRDEELAAAGLKRPHAARVAMVLPSNVDRATALLEHALTACARELDEVLPRWRSLRVGAAIGTSSGGMRGFEDGAAGMSGTYLGPVLDAARPCAFEPVSLVLGACASSAIAIGLGRAWLATDRCDVVLCGGFDAVSVFVAAGFECLRATCGPVGPRPFRVGRDGLALGEGAAIVALAGPAHTALASRVLAWVTGFGSSCDGMHLTAPDPRGEGLARAARDALADAGIAAGDVELVSAHGTATPQNDAAEAAAITQLMGTSSRVPVFAFKGTVGHTLGASGALELLAAASAMERGLSPASAEGGGAAADGVCVLDRTERSSARTALKLSSAFGGVNAALVVRADPPQARAAPPEARAGVLLSVAVSVTLAATDPARLAARTGYGADRIARADDLVRLAIAAVAALEDQTGGRGSLRGAAIVVGHGLATIETNALFLERIRRSGARLAEPRRFPYTTPNAAAGECAVVFGLTGPAFAVGGGPHGAIEALGVAADLVRTRSASRVVVVAVDAAADASEKIAPGTASGAVALLAFGVASDGAGMVAASSRLESCTTRLEAGALSGRAPLRGVPMDAHRALLPLTVGARPSEITVELPWGASAKATFSWL
jgi:3-oxoacyl-[acyl-carrier-protein] synthase-1/3-oxoacyl-[acyl-carrier-protein] synthase II